METIMQSASIFDCLIFSAKKTTAPAAAFIQDGSGENRTPRLPSFSRRRP